MKAKKLECPAPGCTKKPKGALQLNFHIRDEHPTLVDALRSFVKQAYADEKATQAAERSDPDRLWAKLKGLYENCPCGKDLAWHRAGFDAVHRRAA